MTLRCLSLLFMLFLIPPTRGAPGPSGTAAELPVLDSVGRLLVPAVRYRDGYTRHFDEHCSATLITASAQASESSLIISAWHCIEDYRDLSRTLVFESATGQRRAARILSSGGGMHSDWVLLRLEAPLPGPALLVARGASAPSGDLLMAGYPRTEAAHSAVLQTAQDCAVTGWMGRDPRSDCVLRKGASGGAVFAAAAGNAYLGVISRGDGETQSIYVPVSRFRERISSYLQTYPYPAGHRTHRRAPATGSQAHPRRDRW